LIDHLRLDAWPRGFRARARALHEYVDQRTRSGDSRTPTDAELCATLAWTPEQLRTYRFQEQVHQHRVDPFAGTQPATPEQQYATRERRRIVLRAIQALPPNERHIILERFYADRRHADIATDLHVNESRVSQLYQRALGRLRSTLSAA
jgi:RNA polymerase sigma factor (sigma-70 family)